MAIDQSSLRTALVRDAGFIGRLQALLSTIAVQVLGETTGSNLAARQDFAKKVLNDPREMAERTAFYLIMTDNFVGATIEIKPEGSGFAVTISTADADALSQIFTVWDKLTTLFG